MWGEWHMCPAPYGCCLNWDPICAGKTDSSHSLSCQLSEMNIRFPIYGWALTVNVLQLNTRPHSAAIHSFCQLQWRYRDKYVKRASCPDSSDNLAGVLLVHSPINISEWFAKKSRLVSPCYQLGDARGRLNCVRDSRPFQICPMILLLAQWFNSAWPFCCSHTKIIL